MSHQVQQSLPVRQPHLDPTPEELHALKLVLDPDNPHVRLVWDFWCRSGFVATTTFVPGDPYTSARNEGVRAFVIRQAEFVGMNPLNLLKRR